MVAVAAVAWLLMGSARGAALMTAVIAALLLQLTAALPLLGLQLNAVLQHEAYLSPLGPCIALQQPAAMACRQQAGGCLTTSSGFAPAAVEGLFQLGGPHPYSPPCSHHLQVSLVNLVMAAGIAVEFCAHIVYAFLAAPGGRGDRASAALTRVGASVLSGITFTKLVGVRGSWLQSGHLVCGWHARRPEAAVQKPQQDVVQSCRQTAAHQSKGRLEQNLCIQASAAPISSRLRLAHRRGGSSMGADADLRGVLLSLLHGTGGCRGGARPGAAARPARARGAAAAAERCPPLGRHPQSAGVPRPSPALSASCLAGDGVPWVWSDPPRLHRRSSEPNLVGCLHTCIAAEARTRTW